MARRKVSAYKEYWDNFGAEHKRSVIDEAKRKGTRILTAVEMEHLRRLMRVEAGVNDWISHIDQLISYEENVKNISDLFGVRFTSDEERFIESDFADWDKEMEEFEDEWKHSDEAPSEVRFDTLEKELVDAEDREHDLTMKVRELQREIKATKLKKKPPEKIPPLEETKELARKHLRALGLSEEQVEKGMSELGEEVFKLPETEMYDRVEEYYSRVILKKPPIEIEFLPPEEAPPPKKPPEEVGIKEVRKEITELRKAVEQLVGREEERIVRVGVPEIVPIVYPTLCPVHIGEHMGKLAKEKYDKSMDDINKLIMELSSKGMRDEADEWGAKVAELRELAVEELYEVVGVTKKMRDEGIDVKLLPRYVTPSIIVFRNPSIDNKLLQLMIPSRKRRADMYLFPATTPHLYEYCDEHFYDIEGTIRSRIPGRLYDEIVVEKSISISTVTDLGIPRVWVEAVLEIEKLDREEARELRMR